MQRLGNMSQSSLPSEATSALTLSLSALKVSGYEFSVEAATELSKGLLDYVRSSREVTKKRSEYQTRLKELCDKNAFEEVLHLIKNCPDNKSSLYHILEGKYLGTREKRGKDDARKNLKAAYHLCDDKLIKELDTRNFKTVLINLFDKMSEKVLNTISYLKDKEVLHRGSVVTTEYYSLFLFFKDVMKGYQKSLFEYSVTFEQFCTRQEYNANTGALSAIVHADSEGFASYYTSLHARFRTSIHNLWIYQEQMKLTDFCRDMFIQLLQYCVDIGQMYFVIRIKCFGILYYYERLANLQESANIESILQNVQKEFLEIYKIPLTYSDGPQSST